LHPVDIGAGHADPRQGEHIDGVPLEVVPVVVVEIPAVVTAEAEADRAIISSRFRSIASSYRDGQVADGCGEARHARIQAAGAIGDDSFVAIAVAVVVLAVADLEVARVVVWVLVIAVDACGRTVTVLVASVGVVVSSVVVSSVVVSGVIVSGVVVSGVVISGVVISGVVVSGVVVALGVVVAGFAGVVIVRLVVEAAEASAA